MSDTVGVVVRLPERAYARLQAEAGRTGTNVRTLLQRAALAAAEPLPDPKPVARRALREVLRSRVEELRLAGLKDDEIAGQLPVPLERVQAVRCRRAHRTSEPRGSCAWIRRFCRLGRYFIN